MPALGSARATAIRVKAPPWRAARRRERGLAVERHGIGDEPAARTQARHTASNSAGSRDAAAEEDRIGRRQTGERGGRRAEHDLELRHAERRRVLAR